MARAKANKVQNVRIPTVAVYTTDDTGNPVQVHVEYTTIQADAIAKMLLGHFNIPTDNGGDAL